MTAKEQVKKFMAARGWSKQLPDHIAKSISIEAAELLEHFQWATPTAAEIKNNPQKFAELQGELADVFIYGFQLALVLGLDVEKIVKAKLDFADKKYPAELMKQRMEGDTLATEKYLEIKRAHRKLKGKSVR